MINDIKNVIDNRTPIVWLETKEYFRAESIIERVKDEHTDLYLWDVVRGITPDNFSTESPIEVLNEVENSILILYDFHEQLPNVESWRELINTIPRSKTENNMVIIISPKVEIPMEIQHYVSLIKLPLPNIEELGDVGFKGKFTKTKEQINIIEEGLGLTQYEFINALNSKDGVFKAKKQIIEKSGTLKIYNSTKPLSELYGMDTMSHFVKKMVSSGNGKGILILGVPGAGKSEFAKRLGFETDRITINMDFGSMMGSYVGETETNTREAFDTVDAISKSIVFIDEIEKGLSGASNDGVAKRQGGQFLKWMQDKNSDTYIVATANDINSLPPEYLRSGRWDAIFFLDVPDKGNRAKILDLYKTQYNLSDKLDMGDFQYTGAEIETLCRLSSNLDISLKEATKYINPVTEANKDSMNHLRKVAKTKATNAV